MSADTLVAVVAALEEEKKPVSEDRLKDTHYKEQHPDRLGNNIGTFIAEAIADALGVGLEEEEGGSFVWRRQKHEDKFPGHLSRSIVGNRGSSRYSEETRKLV